MMMNRPAAGVALAGLVLLGLVAPSFAQLPPEEELKRLRAAEPFDVSLYASEPLITNPSAIDVDTRGRVWVAEIQWYRGAAKNPPADKIKVLEDTDGDGKADKVTVFAEGLFCPMSICVAGDKVYVATSPDLWVYEDKDGDLKADGPPKKLLTGFGGRNHDHGAHSLALGPDHKWWMAHGDTGFHVQGTDGSLMQYQWGAMLRGELDGSKLETVAVNFRNPYEVCVSSFGEAFFSDNDNDGNFSVRAGWIMEGGNYGWFGGPPGPRGSVPPGTPFGEHWHFRGHIPGNVPATLVTGFGSPCGICYYEGDAFGPKYKDAPLHTDAGPREVRLYRHALDGFGMKATSEVFLTSQGDDYFRPDDICAAPDGALYVSDWYDGGVGGHGYNNPNQGRIFLLKPKGKTLTRHEKPGPYTTVADALEGLKSPNLATQYLARERLLHEGQGASSALRALLADAEPNNRARAVWVLDRIGGKARDAVRELLRGNDSRFRALAIRVLRRHGEEDASAILALTDDPAAEVRREVLLSIPRLKADAALNALVKLAAQYDGTDRYQLEAINIAAGDRKSALYERLQKEGKLTLRQLPLIQVLNPKAGAEFLLARLEQGTIDLAGGRLLIDAAGGISSPDAGRALLKWAANGSAPAELRRSVLEKVGSNLAGPWRDLAGDAALKSALERMLGDDSMRSATLALVGDHQLRSLGDAVMKLAQTPGVDAAARRQAIGVAARLNLAGSLPALQALLADKDKGVRRAALDALVDLQDVKTVRRVLGPETNDVALQRQAADRLLANSSGALLLLRLLDEGRLAPGLKEPVIDKASRHVDSNVRVLYEKYVPAERRPQRLGDSIKADEILALKGDAGRGETVFRNGAVSCRSCHVVQGQGGAIGPDLSQIGKKYERKALLETILEPSKAIAPEYVPYLLETTSGQVYAGFIAERGPKQVVLKDAQGKLTRVPANEVEALAEQKTSLMPELVLKDVSAQDAADLLAYLKALTDSVQPVTRFRVLGPFAAEGANGLDASPVPEATIAAPDLAAKYPGLDGKSIGWDVVPTDNALGFAAIDSVRLDQSRGVRTDGVAHYFLVYADSTTEADANLLLGTDDGCKVWINGQMVHRNPATRALGFPQDRVSARLRAGRNVIVVKVVNGNGPGGVALAVASSAPVQLKTE